MADTDTIDKSIPVDQIFQSQDNAAPTPGQTKRLYVSPAKSVDKPVPFDEVFAQFQKDQQTTPEKGAEPDLFKQGLISEDNKRLTGLQFTKQSPNKDDYIGPAVQGKDLTGDENDDTYYLKKDDGNYEAADKNKHLLMRDPDTGEYGIYKRDREQDYGPITGRLVGLGNFVSQGMQEVPGVERAAGAVSRLPSAAGTATRGQEALGAAHDVASTTGTHVPVPQNAVTTNPIASRASTIIEHLPGGSEPFDRASATTEASLGQARTSAAAHVNSGTVAGAEGAGQTARGAIENYATPKSGILAKRVSAAYDKLDAHVPADAVQDLSNTRKVAQDIQTKFEATRGVSGTNKIDPTIQEVLSAVTDPKGVTYQGIKDLRSRIGEMLESGTKISETGISDKQLRGLYKGLTDDTRALVTREGGARGIQLWERANTYAKLASDRREQLAKVLGTNRSDEGVFGAILTKAGSGKSADAKTLAVAKKSMPADEWNEIASAAAGRLGNKATDKGMVFDSGKFVKDYDQLSDQGKAMLFGDNQRLRKALDSISELAKYEPKVTHPGPLGHLVATAAVVSHEGGEGGTGLGKILHIAGAVVGIRALGNMLSKPATAESVARWMQGYKMLTLKPTQGNVTVFNKLSEALANDAAQTDREHIKDAAGAVVDWTKKLVSLASPFGPKHAE